MRVVHVARYGSVAGGAETYISALAAGQRAAGHQVSLLYGLDPDLSRPEVSAGAQIGSLIEPATSPGQGDAAPLRDALRERVPDVVHVHVPDISWVAHVAQQIAPTLLAVHDHRVSCPTSTRYWRRRDAHCDIKPGYRCLLHNVISGCGSLKANATLKPYTLWLGARSAARGLPIQVFSRYMHGQVSRMGIPRDEVHVLPYPAPPFPGRADDAAMTEADARPIIYASGRLNNEKGFDRLLRALEHVEPAVHLVIAGDGYLAEKLRGMAVPQRHRVSFLGWIDAPTAAAWRARASVVAVPSAWPEPFGIVGIEAMADAKPVVAFAGGGIGEWLVDGVTGIEVRHGDIKAFGRALGTLCSDTEAATEMGIAGAKRATETFGLSDHVTKLDDLYSRVIRRWAPLTAGGRA